MKKYILIVLLIQSCLFAESTVHFQETRYFYALDQTISLEGDITFRESSILLEYSKPEQKLLTFFESTLSIQDAQGYRMIDTNTTPMLRYFFLILQAIHDDNQTLLKTFFDIQKKDETQQLVPKDIAKEALEEVIVTIHQQQVQSLQVKIKNGDRIAIEIEN